MSDVNFTSEDLERLAVRGLAAGDAAEQIAMLRNPPAAIVLDRPCTVGDGIVRLEQDECDAWARAGAEAAAAGRVTRFVPASGAATRMFKDLIEALDSTARPSATAPVRTFLENLDTFAFGHEVRLRSGIGGALSTEEEERRILRTVLQEMGYAQVPKGLVPFHFRGRTAFEDHLLEGVRCTRSETGRVTMHFTVAPEARSRFEALLAELAPEIERHNHGCSLDVTFSEQHPSTDTLAIDENDRPFRGSDGLLLFRPGGHGSLLHNLASTRGDIVSIKNIDNILPAEANGEVVFWKQVLVGYLAGIQREVFALLESCSRSDVEESAVDAAIDFAMTRFARHPLSELATVEAKRQFVIAALDRPLRVCGVVRNEGEPGGAPFWVRQPDASRSVQIVEFAQVEAGSDSQRRIFVSSTHFNPVDIACGLRRWTGEPFDLEQFVDRRAVFIAEKSHEGRRLRALERPGLWNGAMAHWNTICVEVPATTFAPVKTVLDLLRPQHRRDDLTPLSD